MLQKTAHNTKNYSFKCCRIYTCFKMSFQTPGVIPGAKHEQRQYFSTVIECTLCDEEVTGLNPAGCFFLTLLSLSPSLS